MKKVSRNKRMEAITPDEAVLFIEGLREMVSDRDEPTTAISIRVPGNILRVLKLKAKSDGKKYQSLIIEYIRSGLKRGD